MKKKQSNCIFLEQIHNEHRLCLSHCGCSLMSICFPGSSALGKEEKQTQNELWETQSGPALLLRQEHHPQDSRQALRLPLCVQPAGPAGIRAWGAARHVGRQQQDEVRKAITRDRTSNFFSNNVLLFLYDCWQQKWWINMLNTYSVSYWKNVQRNKHIYIHVALLFGWS